LQDVNTFLLDLKEALTKTFPQAKLDFLLRTSKSLKLNILIEKTVFISVRYNSRNGRKDFALVSEGKRVFGYDNLKEWHFHPKEDPDNHIPCDEPSTDQILLEMRNLCEELK